MCFSSAFVCSPNEYIMCGGLQVRKGMAALGFGEDNQFRADKTRGGIRQCIPPPLPLAPRLHPYIVRNSSVLPGCIRQQIKVRRS